MDKNILEAYGITPEILIEKIGDMIIDEFKPDESISVYTRGKIDQRIDAIFKDRVNDLIDSKIEQIMDEAFSIQITPIDQWGDPQGKPFTIRERMYEQATAFWGEKVDDSGKKYTGYNSNKYITRAQFMIEKAVKGEIEKAVKLSAEEATVIFRTALKKSQTDWVAKQIDELVK